MPRGSVNAPPNTPRRLPDMTNPRDQKRAAAQAALELLPNSGVIGLGTGSTAELFIEGLAALVREGRRFQGVPTSEHARAMALSFGIPLLDDEGPWSIDVTVDGADEVSRDLDLIKGGGGCHLREKIINDSSRQNIIIVDESKLSEQLGSRYFVPVEVVRFGYAATAAKLQRFGSVTPRVTAAGIPVVTDSGHLIYDVRTGPIAAPRRLDAELLGIPGVVETGLFVGRASLVVVGGAHGLRTIRPQPTNEPDLT
jgi:ribose 5-phosphate isomerase A